MRIEYMKNMLIDRLIGLDYIYTSDFITKMKNYISDEGDIEKLKDLDGFVTDRVYLDYFKDNIQGKLDEQSVSIFEVKNMIKNSSSEGVGEKESVYSGRDFSYRVGFNSGVVEKDIVKVEVSDIYKNADSRAEDEEDAINIDLNDGDSIGSDDFYENEEDDSDEDDIDIDLEEDSEEEDETGIDLGDDEDEIDIDLEEDDSEEYDSEEEDEIDINLEEDEDDMGFDYEDNDFSGNDSEEDEIDINLEEDNEDDIDLEDEDDNDEIDIDLEEDEDDIDIDLEEDEDDIDIDLEDDEDIDVNLEEDEDDVDTTHSNTPKPKENKQQHENKVKEKVFNNNFSNNTWDILNGAVDGVSNFFKRK